MPQNRPAPIGAFNSGMSLTQSLGKVTTDTERRVSMLRIGGTGSLPPFDNPAKQIEYAENFPSLVDLKTGNPALMAYVTQEFSTADNCPPKVKLPFAASRTVFGEYAALQDVVTEVGNDLAHVSMYPDLFADPDVTALRTEQQRLDSIIRSDATGVAANPTKPYAVSQLLKTDVVTLRQRRIEILPLVFETFGGDRRGQEFNDLADRDVLRSRKISNIQIRSGAVIDAIEIFYSQKERPDYSPGRHGGGGGGVSELILFPGEYIAYVDGLWGDEEFGPGPMIRYLVIGTNTGRLINAGKPFGRRLAPSPDGWRPPPGWAICGFYGSFQLFLNSLGPIYTKTSQKPLSRTIYQYRALCIETIEHNGDELALGDWVTTEDEANKIGKAHEVKTKGHRWRIAVREVDESGYLPRVLQLN